MKFHVFHILFFALLTEGFLHNRPQPFVTRISAPSCSSAVADELVGWNTDAGSEFLEKYWQKRPVLIRNAFPHISHDVEFLAKSDMFRLSYEEDVESRILIKDEEGEWNKEYGPFDMKYTRKLPTADWTILVQEVDRHIPRMADIWQKYFDFIPSWRRDDIMVSYAASGGGIGAHVDSYDVFLIQGRGSRRWSIENSFVSAAEELRREVPNCDTRLITDFRADQSWDLNQGDVLYLPPRVPHQGVSLGDECLTVSMGFRSPTHRSMLTALCHFISENTVPERLMYTDPDLRFQSSSGFIGHLARDRITQDLKSHILNSLDDPNVFDYWLGRYLTIPLRMQLNKPRPFFLQDSKRVSLRRLFSLKGLGGRLDPPVESTSRRPSDGEGSIPSDGVVSSILNGESYEDDEEYVDEDEESEPYFLQAPHRVASLRVFEDADEILNAVAEGRITLRRVEGAKFAFIETAIFVDGEAFEFPVDTQFLGPLLCDRRVLINNDFQLVGLDLIDSGVKNVARAFLSVLVEAGYFYPCDLLSS